MGCEGESNGLKAAGDGCSVEERETGISRRVGEVEQARVETEKRPWLYRCGVRMSDMNSARVLSLRRKAPSIDEVIVVAPGFCTPRMVMHW